MKDTHPGRNTRAAIMFNLPESRVKVVMRESPGSPSKKLREAINGAYSTFWEIYGGGESGVTDREINLVADAISKEKECLSCIGSKPEEGHCGTCTEEAKAAIGAFLRARIQRGL